MAIGRGRYAPPYVSTKGHSVLKQRSYGMPIRTPLSTGVPRTSGAAYDTRAEDFILSDRVKSVNYLSNSTLDEGYDTAKRSRGRDQQLLKEATNAIVSSESYATPQTSVASRRVTRGRSLAPRAASVPPRPLKAEVDSIATSTNTTTATSTAARAPAPTPVSAKRPIVVLPGQAAGRSEDRAKSVSPVVVFMEDKPRRPLVEPTHVRDDWRSKARARSVPPQAAPSVRSRPYVAAERVRPARVEPSFQAALPTSDLRAHKVPRRFLTRTGFRTAFSSLQGYYQPGQLASDRQANDDRYDIKKSVAKARVIASPVAPNTVDRAQGGYRPLQVLPTPKPCPIQESLSEFPKVFVPSKSRKPSNRAKAAIIASKMEPDPLKRRRPRSEYAANKYRELRRETQDSTYGGNASYASSAPVRAETEP